MTPHPNAAADFDFLAGSWTVRHRQLKRRLAGCTEWIEFDGSTMFRKTLGGHGNVDDNVLDHPAGRYCAVSLRSVDPASGIWSIWWLDGRYPGTLGRPVTGAFGPDGVGCFYCDDTWEGQPIRVRYQWSATTSRQPVWEQAYSTDAGQTWELNWRMLFTRAAP